MEMKAELRVLQHYEFFCDLFEADFKSEKYLVKP